LMDTELRTEKTHKISTKNKMHIIGERWPK